MADDNEGDRTLAKEALKEGRLVNDLRFVEDGEELLDYCGARANTRDRMFQGRA